MLMTSRMTSCLRQLVACLLLSILPALAMAKTYTAKPTFTAGVDYRIVPAATGTKKSPGKAQVVEFFNYGCPACFFTEPYIEKWLKTNQNKIIFSRVPVIFHPEWEPLAKAYYIAQAYNRLDKLTPVLFNKIHVQHEDLSKPDKLAAVFQQAGIPTQSFNQAYFHSPTLTQELQNAANLQARYNIEAIPTIVINGRYMVDMGMSNSPERFLATLDYLIRHNP